MYWNEKAGGFKKKIGFPLFGKVKGGIKGKKVAVLRLLSYKIDHALSK